MAKIASTTELNALYDKVKEKVILREKENAPNHSGIGHQEVLVCGGTGCLSSDSKDIVTHLKAAVEDAGLKEQVEVIQTGCFGFCEKGPIVKILPDNTFYVQVTPDDAKEIVEEHLLKGRKVERLLYQDPMTGCHVSDSKHMNFYKKQMRIALRNCGFINPENIEEYIAREGYQALALFSLHLNLTIKKVPAFHNSLYCIFDVLQSRIFKYIPTNSQCFAISKICFSTRRSQNHKFSLYAFFLRLFYNVYPILFVS